MRVGLQNFCFMSTTHFAIRTKQNIAIYEANPSTWSITMQKSLGENEACELISYSPDGALFAACFKDRISLYDASTLQQVKEIAEPFVYQVSWSPLGTFLVYTNNLQFDNYCTER